VGPGRAGLPGAGVLWRVHGDSATVRELTAIAEDGTETVLWEGDDPTTTAPEDLVVTVDAAVHAKQIGAYIDSKRVPGWNEIDAVELVAKDGARQWAKEATASSSYAGR